MCAQPTTPPYSLLVNGIRQFGRLRLLPPGRITPAGWLGRYARLTADSWLLHYARNEDPDVYGKFWACNRNALVGGVFSQNDETLVLSDYTAYFADGMAHYAVLFPDSELAARLPRWIEQLLESQDADGYIGAFQPAVRWQNWLEVFSQCVLLEAVLYWYERTGDRRLLDAAERAIRLQMATWYRPGTKLELWSGHGAISIRAYLKLAALTGNTSYLRFAQEVMSRFGRTRDFLSGGDALMYQHNAVGTEHAGFPAVLYEYDGDPALLEASRAAWDMLAQHHLSVDGTPHGNESMQFKGPLHNCEHCGAVEWFYASNALARMTGEVSYADAAERAMLNAYPAARSPDGMTVAYMHTPNQLVASEWSQPHGWTSPDWCASRQHYHSAHEPLCCNSNGPRGLAHFVESMVMQDDAGLAVVYYGPCSVTASLPGAGQVALRMDTAYPFEDQVRLVVTPETETIFDLALRIPGWCRAARIDINGQAWPGAAAPGAAAPGSFARIRRAWRAGDTISVYFDCPVRYERWARSEFHVRAAGVAVLRGPLTYALPVSEDWQRFDPPAHGPGQGIVAYRVLPAPGAEWAWALVLPHDPPDLNFERVALAEAPGSRPWECPPIGLRVKARRVLNWRLRGDPAHPETPLLPFNPVELAGEETAVTLVPFGCTHLRMTYLPVAA